MDQGSWIWAMGSLGFEDLGCGMLGDQEFRLWEPERSIIWAMRDPGFKDV